MRRNGRTIGFYGFVWQERLRRTFEGVLAYARERQGVNVRDFRASKTIEAALQKPPPWKGLVDAVVVSLGQTGDPLRSAEWILAGGVPAVSVSADWSDPRVANVYTSHESVGKLAARHLRTCGCGSYLFFGTENSLASHGRQRAFFDGLAKTNRPRLEYWSRARYAGSIEVAELMRREAKLAAILRQAAKPVGALAFNDNFARALALLCAEIGLRVPADVAIVGVDDTLIAQISNPLISSVVTPLPQVGRRAMELVNRLLDDPRAEPHTITLPARSIAIRESTKEQGTGRDDIGAVRAFIRRHACSQVKIENLVEVLPISRRTLELRFQELVGHSPREEIQRVRIERAQELLSTTQLSIARISEMVGYAENAAFTKFFRRVVGISPSKYRKTTSQQSELPDKLGP